MREVELKAVVADIDALRSRLAAANVAPAFCGGLFDRRYDTADRALYGKDAVLRLRIYRERGGAEQAWLDIKGPTQHVDGYKVRDEHSTAVGDVDALDAGLQLLGYEVVREIDREVEHYALEGATLRIERYPRLDVLVEVEGEPDAIERAIVATGLPRDTFTTNRLRDFVATFEARTGERAALCARELDGDYRYRESDA